MFKLLESLKLSKKLPEELITGVSPRHTQQLPLP
jgi:hypothetical protein